MFPQAIDLREANRFGSQNLICEKSQHQRAQWRILVLIYQSNHAIC